MEETDTALRNAWDFVEYTGKNIFLTGKAGTGKTTFLRAVRERSTKRMIVVAPTGVAAINANGVTIHSFFQLPLSPYVPGTNMKSRFDFSKEKRKIIASLDLLVIDEISMVRSDLLDAIDAVLRQFKNRYKPFGGVQLLMIGDLRQLTPVVTPEDAKILHPYYTTNYFFGSKALAQTDYVTIQLEKVYRQEDKTFVSILNRIKDGCPTASDLETLNQRYDANFSPTPEDGYIRLTTHNYLANSNNEKELGKLTTPQFTFNAQITGTFPEYAYPTSPALVLKKGAQVMFVKNDPSASHRYYNGRIGRVTFVSKGNVHVRCTGDSDDIVVEPQEWENAKYRLNPETKEIETVIQGTFKQYPLRLAWAITIHKSQGLTFEHAIIDAGKSFAPGQVYVALSRCKTLDGMVLASPLDNSSVINDKKVDSFISTQEEQARHSIQLLPSLKEEYNRQLLAELFDFTQLYYKEEYLERCMLEFFSNSFPSLTQLHKVTLGNMKTRVIDIAAKWIAQIKGKSAEEAHSTDFLERVSRSAEYFHNTLKAIMEKPLQLSKTVKSNNKEAMRRLTETCEECNQLYNSKILLLSAISKKGYSAITYLKEKHLALLDTMGNSLSSKKHKEVRSKEKKKKEKTWETSYKMFTDGMKADEIAINRGLTIGTIFRHLSKFIQSGDIHIEDLIDEQKIKTIQRAIQMGGKNGKAAVKALCPPDISYDEIDLVYNTSEE